ncbi:DUF4168 domain-containing protein [Rhodohalobacter barkolensis]|uniref:DUF4168 domain-containing protein n=1 Tax=Rhodohalobacter barkolensis TaxID=2053187 RepID=A0A2N0VEP2_9BACT|nr:DUF4168 domain-containing protein [Rhodohalobacter barkolensis]PKD42665.1 hypothetical protein CWD77_14760 [Rhodohalobacter barkolensis]
MKFFKSINIALIAILFGAGSLFAQVQQQTPPPQQQQEMPDLPSSDDVSDEEIEQVANAINELGPIQVEAQEKMAEAVEKEDITFERFQQMMMAMQNPQAADQVDVTDEEMEKLQTLQPALMEIQSEADEKMMEKIESNGISVERYQNIVMAAQQDQELRSRVEALLEDEEE